DLVRAPDPDAAAADIQAVLDAAVIGAAPGFAPGANLAAPLLPPAPPPAITSPPPSTCKNARIAIAPAAALPAADRVYAGYTRSDPTADVTEPFHALRRAAAIEQDPAPPGNARWAVRRDWTAMSAISSLEDQGGYNLVLGVSPDNPDLVVFGMVNVFVSDDAGVTWQQSIEWQRYDTGDWGHHADQHAAVFVPQTAGP